MLPAGAAALDEPTDSIEPTESQEAVRRRSGVGPSLIVWPSLSVADRSAAAGEPSINVGSRSAADVALEGASLPFERRALEARRVFW